VGIYHHSRGTASEPFEELGSGALVSGYIADESIWIENVLSSNLVEVQIRFRSTKREMNLS
jgi:hypothetical protein